MKKPTCLVAVLDRGSAASATWSSSSVRSNTLPGLIFYPRPARSIRAESAVPGGRVAVQVHARFRVINCGPAVLGVNAREKTN